MENPEKDDFRLPDDAGDYVDVATFMQILEMDDHPDRHFSRGLIHEFFEQAEFALHNMDQLIQHGDLEQLSSLSSFFYGSSATLGAYKVAASCRNMQHLGALKDESGVQDISAEEAVDRIRKLVQILKQDYIEAKKWFINCLPADTVE